MVKKLTRHGNSMALVIERPVLELLNIDAETPLEVSTDGKVLIITPIHDPERRKRFEHSLQQVNKKYGRVLKRLAE